jgi:hypothetical protein
MEGGISELTKGMIPRAVGQVFQVAEGMRKKGWEYKLEGQFLEIVSLASCIPKAPLLTEIMQYNETINDLLGTGELDKKKHEIKHDKTSTRVTDVNVVPLHSATQVQSLLSLAKSRRTVAATLMKCVATLNLLQTQLTMFTPANVRLVHIRSSPFGYQERTSRVVIPAKVRSTSSISLVRNGSRRVGLGTTRIG